MGRTITEWQEVTLLGISLPLHNDIDSAQRAIVVRNNPNMVNHMLEVVCSALLTCDKGQSALQLAKENGRSATLLALIKAGLRMDKLCCLE